MLQWMQANPVLTSVIVTVLIGLGTGIWKAARWVQKTEDTTSGTAAVLRELQQKLLDEFKELRAVILARHALTVETNSPLQPNELGRRVVEILGTGGVGEADGTPSEERGRRPATLPGRRVQRQLRTDTAGRPVGRRTHPCVRVPARNRPAERAAGVAGGVAQRVAAPAAQPRSHQRNTRALGSIAPALTIRHQRTGRAADPGGDDPRTFA